MEYGFKFVVELWLFAATFLIGIGPGTAVWRWTRLPACYWVPLTLASTALVSYALLWLFLFDPWMGRVAAVLCLIASTGWFGWQLRSNPGDAWVPGALMLALLLAYLFILFARDAPINY